MPARILVTGSRTWNSRVTIASELSWMCSVHGYDVVIVHGHCPTGADAMADQWAMQHHVQVERHPADWSTGKGAGFARNAEMVNLGADVCLAFIRDGSKGATHTAGAGRGGGHRGPGGSWHEPPRFYASRGGRR